MLEIVQAGQAGKTDLLFDMHRLRKRVFKDRMGWDVTITPGGLEVDDFDLPNAVYLLALDDNRRVIGNWRLLPTDGPTMIRDIWPHFLGSIEMPAAPHFWEASRFAVDSLATPEEAKAQVSRATQELFCGLTELCLLCGIEKIFTLYDMRIARLLKRLDCQPEKTSKKMSAGGYLTQVGCFATNEAMLERLRKASNIRQNLIRPEMIPLFLQTMIKKDYYINSEGYAT